MADPLKQDDKPETENIDEIANRGSIKTLFFSSSLGSSKHFSWVQISGRPINLKSYLFRLVCFTVHKNGLDLIDVNFQSKMRFSGKKDAFLSANTEQRRKKYLHYTVSQRFAVLFSSDEHCSHLLLQGTFHMLCKIPAVRQLPISIES